MKDEIRKEKELKEGTLAAVEKIDQILNQYMDWDYEGILSELKDKVIDAKTKLKVSYAR